MKKRIISALLALSMLCPTVTLAVKQNIGPYDVDTIIEAEDCLVDGGCMIAFYEGEAFSDYAVRTSTRGIDDVSEIMGEDIALKVNIPENGEYYVYLRCNSGTKFYTRFDEGEWKLSDFGSCSFEWVKLKNPVELEKGVHKFSYNHITGSGIVDAIYFSKDGKLELPSPRDLIEKDEEEEEASEDDYVMLENLIHEQDGIFEIQGTTGLIEAEDGYVTDHYAMTSAKSASGGKGIKVKKTRSSAAGVGWGDANYRFRPTESGSYNAWVRCYAVDTKTDSLYGSLKQQSGGYNYIETATYNQFEWYKADTLMLEAGKVYTFKLATREQNNIVDCILFTTATAKPTGRTGNIKDDASANIITSLHAKPPVYPPKEHPRVLFTANDIERIKQNIDAPQNGNARANFLSFLEDDEPLDGDAGGKVNESLMNKIEAYAFDYAIYGNVEHGEQAAAAIVKYLKTTSVDDSSTDNVTRKGGETIFKASEVYDWCYDLLSTQQKLAIIKACEVIAGKMEIKWPPDAQGAVSGHGAEAQLLRDDLAFAIATYNERPDIWESVGGRFYEDYIEFRNYLNNSSWAIQGDSYGLYRHRFELFSYFLIKGMGVESPYDDTMGTVGYSMIYMRRPDGQMMRDGDTSYDTDYVMWEYWSMHHYVYYMDAALSGDPYLKGESALELTSFSGSYEGSSIMALIINDPNVDMLPKSNLPKSRFFGDPANVMVARTGWEDGVDCDTVVAEMKIGGLMVVGHQHNDLGHFQLYYKGILASDSGVYQGLNKDGSSNGGTNYNSDHRDNYMVHSIAHNTMLIQDTTNPDDSGVQLSFNNRSEVPDFNDLMAKDPIWGKANSYEIDRNDRMNPDYSYVSGDITRAYSSSKINEYDRSFMFFNMKNEEVPGVLVVFDRVDKKNSKIKDTWLLHGLEEPIVNGNQTTFARTYESPVSPNRYNGKMIVDTLVPTPDNTNIEVVGGEEDGYSVVNGVDHCGYPAANHTDEGSTYRIEVSKKDNSQNIDYFLNVLQVSDNDKNYYIQPTTIETDEVYGVAIGDRAVTFSKSGKRIEDNFEITLPATDTKAAVCDVKAGKWQVKSGSNTEEVFATDEGGVLYFTAKGKVSLQYVDDTKPEPLPELVLPTEKNMVLRVGDSFVNCRDGIDSVNGKAMISADLLADWFDAEITNDGATMTFTRSNATISMTEGTQIATINGEEVDMGVAPYKKNQTVMIPVREFVIGLGGKIDWIEFPRIISVERPPKDFSLPSEGYAIVKGVTPDNGAVDGGNVAENTIDGIGTSKSIWAANGKSRYVDYEFAKPEKLDRVEILFNPNGGRTARFEILVSNDGENYTSLIDDVSDGSLEDIDWEIYYFDKPVTTKYVRYLAKGSNISDWNAIMEIRFRQCK